MTPSPMQTMDRAMATAGSTGARTPGALGRPSFRWADIWQAPLHDIPIRDEILYQYMPLSAGMSVLEVGPGGGFTAFRLSRHVRKLTLVDVGSQHVEQLRHALREAGNVTLVCADICEPDLKRRLEERFDAAYAIEVFEFLRDPAACVLNLAEVLRPEAPLMIQFPNYPPPLNAGVTYFRTRSDLDELLDRAGFRSWQVWALRLRPPARAIFRELHERPLRLYRRIRAGNGTVRPLTYESTWAYQQSHRLDAYKYLLHGAWAALLAAARLGGPCFERELLADDILARNLVVTAVR